jgi:hypothetical protein
MGDVAMFRNRSRSKGVSGEAPHHDRVHGATYSFLQAVARVWRSGGSGLELSVFKNIFDSPGKAVKIPTLKCSHALASKQHNTA